MEAQPNDKHQDNSLLKLTRALFYESQYRNAILSDALSFFDINLTTDTIGSDFFFKHKDGELVSVPEEVGLPSPCKFSDFVNTWAQIMIPETSLLAFKDISRLRDELLDLFAQGKRDYTVDYWIETPENQKMFLHQQFLMTKNEFDDVCALAIIKDYTNTIKTLEQSQHKQIERYAYIDPITNGPNYVKFKETIRRIGKPGVIISVDMKSFKIINSICGIQKGDEVIKEIWNVILKNIDPTHEELAAHINADHFIIFLPTYIHDDIVDTIKTIKHELNRSSIELDIPSLSPYFGITHWDSTKRVELAYSETIAAIKNARETSGFFYAFFEEKDTDRLVEEKKILDNFELAMQQKEFKIWYQPKYDPKTNKLVGAEALVRWKKNDGNIIPPTTFIPIFERNSMIRILDSYIFRRVCMQQKKWAESGKQIVPISINISRASLYYQNIVGQYKQITEDIGIDTKYTPIEITESAAIDNEDIKAITDDFHNAGFALHMDDFGSGYSSLASLNTLHFETLKLDKSLIYYIGSFAGNRLIEHTVYLAKELGIHITAEGVEQESQVEFLRHIGCDSIQGFYYSKPVQADTFEKLLDTGYASIEPKKETPIETHINQFRQNLVKPSLYSFIVNLSKDTFTENYGSCDWHEETKLHSESYQESVNNLAKDFILPEYKEAYLYYMNREKLIADYHGIEETRIFQYERMYKNQRRKMRMITNTFKIPESDDIWLFFTVTILE